MGIFSWFVKNADQKVAYPVKKNTILKISYYDSSTIVSCSNITYKICINKFLYQIYTGIV